MGLSKLRIAIIGCGAVAELVHLPALAKIGLRPVLLVDKDLQRAQTLADRFHVEGVSQDYQVNMGAFDAAIVAIPHHLHAPVTLYLLAKGVHVLVEKPMAMTSVEAQDMQAAAKQTDTILAVGMSWHFRRAQMWVKGALEANLLGNLKSFNFQEGRVFDWPVISDFTFLKKKGGGVLLDTGSHVLDLLIWWLGEVAEFTYQDDSIGGVEANCEINLTMASGVRGFVALSRTRNLRCTAIIKGTHGEIEVGLSTTRLRANPPNLLDFKAGDLKGNRLGTQADGNSSELELLDWINSIETGRQPSVTGEATARSITLIENMRNQRRTIAFPWLEMDRAHGLAEPGDKD